MQTKEIFYKIKNTKMDWLKLSIILNKYYSRKGLIEWFERDEKYLSNAFKVIENLWFQQYDKIDKINFVMFSEAPLWGNIEKYVYNPSINNSQFFYRSDLEYSLNERINSKIDFINKLNEIGFIIIDISPYALNEKDTIINYRDISIYDYRQLLKETIPLYLSEKLDLVKKKKNKFVKYFFRYSRVREAFNDLISDILIDKKLIQTASDVLDISQSGGGINRMKLKGIIDRAKLYKK